VPTAPSPVLIFDEGSVHISVYDAQDPAYKLSPAELAKIQELLSLLPASHLQNIKTIQINPAPMQYGIVQGSATYAGDTLTIGAGPTANRANDPLNIPYELLDGIGQAVYDHVLIDYVRQNMVGSFNDSPRSAFANSYALYVTNTLQTFSQAWGAFQNHAYGFSLGQVMYDLWRATIVATLFTGPYATALMDQSTSFFVPSSGGPLGSTTVRDQPFFQHPGQYIQIGRYRLIEGTDPNMGGLAIVSIEDMTTQQIIVLIQPQAIPEMVGETVPINYDYRPLNYNYL
jgi:hypothetical protein